MNQELRDYGRFLPECVKRGIGKSRAYELANAGDLETFTMGSKRFVYIDSLLSLPQRLAERQQAAAK